MEKNLDPGMSAALDNATEKNKNKGMTFNSGRQTWSQNLGNNFSGKTST